MSNSHSKLRIVAIVAVALALVALFIVLVLPHMGGPTDQVQLATTVECEVHEVSDTLSFELCDHTGPFPEAHDG